jgi:hypothetical protein
MLKSLIENLTKFSEVSENFQKIINLKLPVWMIIPLVLLAGFPSIQSYVSSSKETVLLPANKLWLNTGLQIKPGQEVKITATGSINLAIHRLVEAAHTHKYPRWGWMEPEGGQPLNPAHQDLRIKQYLISPDNNYGVLLACITTDDLGKSNPKPKNVSVIGRNASIKSEKRGKLWLVVNDAVLNKDAKNAYVQPQKDLDATYGVGKVTVKQREEEWKRIVDDGYFDAYFDDNAGAFLVQLQIVQ